MVFGLLKRQLKQLALSNQKLTLDIQLNKKRPITKSKLNLINYLPATSEKKKIQLHIMYLQKVIELSLNIQKLKDVIELLQNNSNSKIEFLGLVRSQILKYENLGDEYLHKLISINKEDYPNFFKTIREIENFINSIPIEKRTGEFKSVKNGILYKYDWFEEYNIRNNAINKIFEIWERGREDKSKFSFILREMENKKDLKVIDLFPDSEKYYLGNGIAISMILECKKLFGKRIISSSNLFPSSTNEARWEDATKKVWEKLVNQELAKYDSKKDIFYTI
jgi:hypothetical protein